MNNEATTTTMNESFLAKCIRVLLVVSAYWIVSISMVFLNKYLLSSDSINLDAPLFITWTQCVVAVVVLYLLGELGKVRPELKIFPPFEVKLEVMKKVLPLSAVFVGMIMCNNLCLKFVGVAFYNVGRSLTTVFNVVFTFAILREKVSLASILWCCVIIAGFFLGIDQEFNVSYAGVFFGVSASLFVALNSIFVKKVLPVVESNEWKLTLYNNANGALLFLPLIIASGETSTVFAFTGLTSLYFWFMVTLSGLFGILISLVSYMQIKHTSPLTHNISGTAKACFQTVLAVSIFNEDKSILWWLSNFMVFGGSAGYTHQRHSEMKQKHQQERAQEIEMKVLNVGVTQKEDV